MRYTVDTYSPASERSIERKNESMKRAFTNGIILDGTKDMVPQRGKAVLTEDGIIMDIVPDNEIPGGYEKNDLGGKYILPGLINLHVHLAGSGKPKKKQSDPVENSTSERRHHHPHGWRDFGF